MKTIVIIPAGIYVFLGIILLIIIVAFWSKTKQGIIRTFTKVKNVGRKLINYEVKENKLITYVIVAIAGGIPGIYSLYLQLSSGPDFFFRSKHISSTSRIDTIKHLHNGIPQPIAPPGIKCMLIITGALHNPGNEPLYPDDFAVRLTYDDTVVSYLPEHFKFDSTIGQPLYKAAQKNLMSVLKIDPKETVFGSFFFPTQLTPEWIAARDPVKIEFSCTDIMDKVYKIDASFKRPLEKAKDYVYFEKYGLDFDVK